jgi:hypothetical protein
LLSLTSAALGTIAHAADMQNGAGGQGDFATQETWEVKKVKRLYGIRAVQPGMNQTELQSVMGPPDYVQVNGVRQAWQFCPHFLERLRIRRGDFIQSMEHLFARRDGNFFVTVWFLEGQVVHLRAYPDDSMGNCADFYAAFRWEDMIDGEPGYWDTGVYGKFTK